MRRDIARVAQRGTGVALAGVLALAALVVPAAPASADTTITANEQTFYGYYRLDAIHSSGYTGEGVTIALIDGPVNTQIPELAGARIQSYSPCAVGSQDKYWDHGTVIAQVISSPQFGVAPGANLRAYTKSFEGDTTGSDCAIGQWGRGYSDLALLIEDALNDGVDVITTSSSYPSDYEGMRWALARAIAAKVPVVACTGNDSARNSTEWLPSWGGVVGVGAIETNGRPSDYQNWGRPLSTVALARPRPFGRVTGTRRVVGDILRDPRRGQLPGTVHAALASRDRQPDHAGLGPHWCGRQRRRMEPIHGVRCARHLRDADDEPDEFPG